MLVHQVKMSENDNISAEVPDIYIPIQKNTYITAKLLTQILSQIEQDCLIDATITDDHLSSLTAICGADVTRAAAELLDKSHIVCYHTSSALRSLYKIFSARGGTVYTLRSDINYCACVEYSVRVVRGDALLCEHVLALKLAQCARRIGEHVTVPEARLAEMLRAQYEQVVEDEATKD